MSVDRINYSSVCKNYCTGNYEDILQSTCVVCLHCKKEFLKKAPTTKLNKYEVVYDSWDFDFIVENDKKLTTQCPKCYVDAVIGNKTTSWTRQDVEYWHKKGFGI